MRSEMTLERAMQRVAMVPIAGCWLWLGSLRGKDQYGVLISGGTKHLPRWLSAHRFFYERMVGPIPAGMQCCHRCDVPCCVNPAHIFLGTPLDNMNDKINKGRHRWGRVPGEKHGNSRLTVDGVLDMRSARDSGVTLEAIAQRHGVSVAHAHRIVNRKAWAHVA